MNFFLFKLSDFEAKSNQIDKENADLKENYSLLSREKGILEKKCSTVSFCLFVC